MGENAEPGEWVDLVVFSDERCGNRGPAVAVEAIAAGDEVAGEFMLLPVVQVADARLVGGDVVDGYVLGFEENGGGCGGDKVLDDLVLGVDGDGAAA